ncbi:hypothetical protein J4G46_04500 [Acinetobacter towneri]|uniref:hypothetical protein n=1 Tax=Acinetobacter towneri TaxID=202956 RepID=UPI001AA05313|nr:hypothetical protein [Acinetobacter towneri]QTD65072.1 hypothetical protein J4G46_04500 [Acinetobacter towneri]
MTEHAITFPFRKPCLATAIGLLLANPSYALQALSDDSLSNTTGEGVALVLDDFKMVFQQPNDLSTGSSYTRGLENPSQYDTGFIRIIPTGENYQYIQNKQFEEKYKIAYTNQYDNSHKAVYKTSETAEYDRVYQGEFDKAFAAKKVENEKIYSAYEFQNQEGTLYKERYDYWRAYHGPGGGGTYYVVGNPRNTIANTKALNDLNNVDQWKKELTRRVNEKLTIDATPIAVENAKALADMYALKQVELHANQVIRDTVNQQANITHNRTKADVFIYGLALSKSDNSLSSRYSNQGFNWGSADNPWLFRAGTEKVKQFKNIEKDVGYLALEAPLATTTPTESDNNIKLGFWTDIFSRQLNSSAEVDPSTGAPKSGLDKEYRLRTQFIANGLSLNGSQTRLFQTLDSDNPNHHQTLGMASVLRLNTNDNPANLSFTDSNLDSKGIRISTAAKSDTLDGTAVTPAIDGSLAPVFHDTEGLYLYSPNVNLVLGNMYQPFVVGSEGNNIVLEVTRIPNVPEIYNKIYQNYEDGKGGYLGSTAFTGSTCNVVSCGTPLKANVNDSTAMYQGRNATHSSIAIGTVERLPNNMLRAKDHDNATGVVFKGVDGTAKNLGSVAIDGVLIQHLKFKTTGL